MIEILLRIRIFVVACWAVALIVIHQVFTSTRVASSFGAIGNVSASLLSVNELLLESAVALTVVIINMIPRWGVVINTLPIWTTHVSSAIVFVEATHVRTLLTISHTFRREFRNSAAPTAAGRQWLSETSIKGVTRRARELSSFTEDKRLFLAVIICVRWHNNIAALHRLAPLCVTIVLP
jgi:hypothetical protein